MQYEIYWHRVALVVGFIVVGALFFVGFLMNDDDNSLTGYVVLDQGVRVSTEKMDAALIEQLQQGETQPRVIVVLEEDSTPTNSEIDQAQEQFLQELSQEVVTVDFSQEADESVSQQVAPTQQNDDEINSETSGEEGENNGEDTIEQIANEPAPETEFIVTQTLDTAAVIAGEVLSADALVALTQNDQVAKILLDYPVAITLDGSVGRIGAPLFWNSTSNSTINGTLIGYHKSVCVVDTGILYNHSAFGNCSPVMHVRNGTAFNLSTVVESAHPYTNSLEQTYVINKTGFDRIAVHFVNISLETISGGVDTLDRVYVYNSQNQTVAVYKESMTDVWTPHVEGDTIYIKLVTDSSVTGYGFYIDQIFNGTSNTTMNWSTCSVVKGGWDTYNNDPNPVDGNGHGTHVAGIIGSRNQTYPGVAPGIGIVALKALNDAGSGYSSDVIAAIEWCTANVAKYNISAISMSLGCSGSSCTHYQTYCNSDAINPSISAAVAKNISVFIATGNDGWTNGISNPSCIQNATPVGGVSEADSMEYNRGTLVNIVAPATSIMSAYITDPWKSLSGTSMATPHVAAASVLMREFYQTAYNITLTPQQVEDILGERGNIINDSSSSKLYRRLNFSEISKPNMTYISPTPSDLETAYSSSVVLNMSSDVSFSTVKAEVGYANGTRVNLTTAQYYSTNSSHYFYNITIANLTSGNATYRFYGIDFLNKSTAMPQRTVIIDLTVAPFVLISPVNNSQYYSNVTLRINTSNANNLSYWLRNASLDLLLNSTNTSLNASATITTNLSLAEGNYTLFIHGNSSASNITLTRNYSFVVDNTTPTITFANQSPAVPIAGEAVTVILVATEKHLNTSSVLFYTNSTGSWSNSTLSGTTTSTTNNITFTYIFNSSVTAREGAFSYELKLADLAGNNISSGVRTVTIAASGSVISSPSNGSRVELGSNMSYSGNVNLSGSYTVLWLFGDGTNSTNTSGTKVYTKAGTYLITLNGTNSSMNRSAIRTITVSDTAAPTIDSADYLDIYHIERDNAQSVTLEATDVSGITKVSINAQNKTTLASCTNVSTSYTCNASLTHLVAGTGTLMVNVTDSASTAHTTSKSYASIVVSCSDAKQNGDEEGVDCGGSCSTTCDAAAVEAVVSEESQATLAAEAASESADTTQTQVEAKPVDWESDAKSKSMSAKGIALGVVWSVIAILGVVYAIFVRRK